MRHRIIVLSLMLLGGTACTSPSSAPPRVLSGLPHMGAIILTDGRELGRDQNTFDPMFLQSRLAFGYDLKKPEFVLVSYSAAGVLDRSEVLTRRSIDTFYVEKVRGDGVKILKEVSFARDRWRYRVSGSNIDFAVDGANPGIADFLREDKALSHPGIQTKKKPNKAPEPTTMAVTIRAPSSTARASHGRGSSLTLGKT